MPRSGGCGWRIARRLGCRAYSLPRRSLLTGSRRGRSAACGPSTATADNPSPPCAWPSQRSGRRTPPLTSPFIAATAQSRWSCAASPARRPSCRPRQPRCKPSSLWRSWPNWATARSSGARRSVLALGYCFSRRRSELAGLDYAELGGGDGVLKIAAESLEVHLARSKRANPGDPETFVVPREKNSAAVDAVDRWLSLANVRAGEPVLRRVHKY